MIARKPSRLVSGWREVRQPLGQYLEFSLESHKTLFGYHNLLRADGQVPSL